MTEVIGAVEADSLRASANTTEIISAVDEAEESGATFWEPVLTRCCVFCLTCCCQSYSEGVSPAQRLVADSCLVTILETATNP